LLDDSVVYTRLLESRDFETRTKLREEIRRKVARINVTFGGGNLSYIASVCFVNGVSVRF
jgi:hypothetical protein